MPSLAAGVIIGKGGSNIKMLQARSGARVTVNNHRNCVEISGSASAVAEARRLVQQQIKAFQATGAVLSRWQCNVSSLAWHAAAAVPCQ